MAINVVTPSVCFFLFEVRVFLFSSCKPVSCSTISGASALSGASGSATASTGPFGFTLTRFFEEAKSKASEILRDATDEAKRVAIETEELKRQSRVFHQRLLAAVEGQLSLASAPEWEELLQPTAIYLQNSDVAFKEVVEKVLDEHVPDSNDAASFDATRQFTPDEMAELQRRVAESNKQVKDFSNPDVDETNDITSTPVYFGIEDSFESEVANFPISAPVDEDNDSEQEVTVEKNLNETQTFKLNISE